MTTEIKKDFATEGGHWYDAKTGEPRYSIIGKNGKERNTTLRDARTLGLVPSVTTITKILEKPALGAWLQKQVLMAALTLTRKADESDEAWIDRIMEDSQAQSKSARDKGTLIHGAIERHAQGKMVEPEHFDIVNRVEIEMEKLSLDLKSGLSEKSFAHADGYGGKVDWHSTAAVVDYKTKDKIEDGKTLAYDEHVMQLAAYAEGLGIVAPRCVNVFVGVTDGKVVCVEHDAAAIGRGLRMFKLALAIWKEKNNVE